MKKNINETIRNLMKPVSRENVIKGLSNIMNDRKDILKHGIDYDDFLDWLEDNDFNFDGNYCIKNNMSFKIGRVLYKYIESRGKVKESIVMRFSDIENLEFRKGSLEYGDKVKQLIEFLRIYKNENDDKLVFNINDFEKSSKMKISEIEEIKNLPYKKSLIDFDIDITNSQIIFTNLQNKKSIHTESLINKILKLIEFNNK